eukprot:m.286484 g.286484  ORF g.286484 m.286484 type:complete len:56 (-) comp16212_c0_seq1:7273-7440(-)
MRKELREWVKEGDPTDQCFEASGNNAHTNKDSKTGFLCGRQSALSVKLLGSEENM